MKQFILSFVMALLLGATNTFGTDVPFHRGVNLTTWLQESGATQIQFNKFTKKDFENIQSLGCDVIRLPINLHEMTNGDPDYIIDPLLFNLLDQIIDWAEELDMHLILDNHSFDPSVNTSTTIGTILTRVWPQIAARYKDRSPLIYYEILNEPHGISDAVWNAIQQQVIDSIRVVDSTHTIIVGPAGWNSYNNLRYMPTYADTNLIYTFHFYDPFLFTHQGASWTNPSMVPISGVPFPYDPIRMPACPPELKGTWLEGNFNSYPSHGTISHVKSQIDIAARFQSSRNVPLFCGEFGVYMINCTNADRVLWYQVVRSYLEEKNIAWTIWDYKGGFGLFEMGGNDLFDYDLNVPLVEALGLTAPEQKEFQIVPDSTGFNIYRDYMGPGINELNWTNGGTINLYSTDSPAAGNYCIAWTGGGQYAFLGFDFKPNKNLIVLVNRGYALSMKIRGDTPGSSFDVRFVDTKTADPDDHPWRMRVTIDSSMVSWDNQWHDVLIPLNTFTEHGSWDNGWFEPQGDFDWTVVDQFNIVAEQHAFTNRHFWFDEIRIVNPAQSIVDERPLLVTSFRLLPNYPNPFNPTTHIRYEIPTTGLVSIKLFNTLGQEVATLVDNTIQQPGMHTVSWPGTNQFGQAVSSGLYICTIQFENQIRHQKMLLMQ